jgi:hypothetical protein
MTAAAEMIRSYPADLGGVDREALIRCIEECVSCAQACSVALAATSAPATPPSMSTAVSAPKRAAVASRCARS